MRSLHYKSSSVRLNEGTQVIASNVVVAAHTLVKCAFTCHKVSVMEYVKNFRNNIAKWRAVCRFAFLKE